ncbi:MAG: hypothetical protein J0I67_06605 [Bosea sp.]|nr:hypothetical protein [Bosea sp. (in: a-proteobacteria)]
MVKLFLVLGLALLAGGAYAIVDGWPYRVLERGFTEVILGALSFAAGLLMFASAAILSEIQRLKMLVAGAMATATLASVRHDEPAAQPLPRREEATLPEPQSPMQERLTAQAPGSAAVLAGAGALALGGALAASSRTEEPGADSTETTEVAEAAVSFEEPAGLVDEPDIPELPARIHDDWLRPPGLSTETAQAGLDPVAKTELDFFEAALLPTRAPQVAVKAPESPAEDLDEPAPAMEDAGEKLIDVALEPERDIAVIEPEPEAESEAKREPEQLWWPQLDLGAEGKSQPAKAEADYDDFSALREQLNDALAMPADVPEVEPPQRSLEAVSDWMAPRPWPPVTQPRSGDALAALEEPIAAEEVPALPEDQAVTPPEPVPDEVEPPPVAVLPLSAAEPEAAETIATDILPETAPAAPEAPAASETAAAPVAEAVAPEPAAPPASDEGIVGAYQVGETHFTIYADGSIQARTPDGDYVFASMDELKAYLASEKSRLEAGPG